MVRKKRVPIMVVLSEYCRTTLYRATWLQHTGAVSIYAHGKDRDSVRRQLTTVLHWLSPKPLSSGTLLDLLSYHELIERGVSEATDLRIFEMALRDGEVAQWVDHPLFLSTDPTLISLWMMLLIQRATSAALAVRVGHEKDDI